MNIKHYLLVEVLSIDFFQCVPATSPNEGVRPIITIDINNTCTHISSSIINECILYFCKNIENHL